jgi:nucleoside-diphosphate-sugar epimerase
VDVASASYSGSPAALPLPQADLDHVHDTAPVRWEDLRERRLFITGGTGFVGTWLLASFARINARLDLDAQITVLTRRPEAFAARMPRLAADPSIELLRGDAASFERAGPFDLVVHAASQEPVGQDPSALLAKHEADLGMARHVLDQARRWGASRLLLTSSGAVYGVQPPGLDLVEEDYPGRPDPKSAQGAYGRAKRAAEALCETVAADSSICCTIARCFTFVGPLLPLDQGYAAGNFLRDALRGGPIEMKGDGTPCRSYMHPADLAAWLWTILLRGGSCRPYNVGSDRALSIAELADRVAALIDPTAEVRAHQRAPRPAEASARYVPCIERARTELGLEVRIDLDDALHRTWAWLHDDRRHEWAR